MIKEEEDDVFEDFIASRDNFVATRQASNDTEDDDDACDSIDLHLSTTAVVVSSDNVSMISAVEVVVFILVFEDFVMLLLFCIIIHG